MSFNIKQKFLGLGKISLIKTMLAVVGFLFFGLIFNANFAFADSYDINVSISPSPLDTSVRNGEVSVSSGELEVTTNCQAGYDLFLHTSVPNNKIYLNGDSSASTGFNPSNGTSSLNDSPNTWGFIFNPSSAPTGASIFSAVSSSSLYPNILRTTSETASDTDIHDTYNIYYGLNASMDLPAGSYRLIPDSASSDYGGLTYYAVTSPTCASGLVVDFNKNLNGEGGETPLDPSDIVTNFPASSENILDPINNTLTLSNKTPARPNYIFKEWNTETDGTGDYYYPGDVIPISTDIGGITGGSHNPPISGIVTLYAIWVEKCAANTICYDDNHADAGTMADQTISGTATTATLIASNFSRSNYGFAGWNTAPDGTGTQYGPNEDITFTAGQYSTSGLKLYARWIESAGMIQSWSGCKNMEIGDVTALMDQRDGNTYTVAKLADGNCWMTENLRLDTAGTVGNNTIDPTVTNESLAQGYAKYSGSGTNYGYFAGLANPETSHFTDEDYYPNSLYSRDGANNTININSIDSPLNRMPRYNNNNTNSRASSATGSGNTYSYGNYYTWSATIASTDFYTTDNQTVPRTSICPVGWHLPIGGTSANATKSDFWQLGVSLMGAAPSNNSYYQATELNPSGDNSSQALRKYPNNLVYSGSYSGSAASNRGSYSFYQTSANNNYNYSYRLWMSNNATYVGSNTNYKYIGNAVRCVASEPTYPVAVSMDSHIRSISFTNSLNTDDIQTVTTNGGTVDLYENTSYSIRATTFNGYTLDLWSTDESGTLGSPTANPTSFIVTGASFLAATSVERRCAANTICYMPNGDDVVGTMADQTISGTATTATLIASNFSRSNYGFAGWNTAPDGTGTQYGPNEDITFTAGQYSTSGLKLYARWIESAGMIQSWSGCKNMEIGDVTALMDQRDGNTYTVAKLADGNCWMTENLRLDTAGTVGNNTIDPTVTNESLAQGYAKYSGSGTNYGYFAGLANPETSHFTDEDYYPNSLYSRDGANNTININSIDSPLNRMPRYNNNNTNSRASSATGSGNTYSYGNYYTWSAAIADTSHYSEKNQSAAHTSLCPTGWHLPVGGDSDNAANSNYWQLGVSIMGAAPTNSSYYQSTEKNPSGDTASQAFRKYPNNFVYSGYFTNSSARNRKSEGNYQSSTNYRRFRLTSTIVYAGTNDGEKYLGNSVRCLMSRPYHRVPISMDAHVTSVVVTNSSDSSDTQTVTTSGDTVALYENTPYSITAITDTGYELKSWATDENGILDSTTANPSTFTIIGSTMLSATSQERPIYNTVVNFDSGVSSITLYNAEYGTHSVSTSGEVVPLSRGIKYSITATTNNGYRFNYWSTEEGGSLDSTRTNPSIFTITTPTTLSATTVSMPALTCTKQYRLQNADGTYPDAYISDGSELVSYNGTCSYTKEVENYETKTISKTILNDTTISLDLPRTKFALTIEYDDSSISGVIGEGSYRWGQEVRIASYPSSGYIFKDWSQTAGTASSFGDTTDSETTFVVPLGGATIYARGEAITYPNYIVTVNMDEHVTSVLFESDECEAKQAIVSGETVVLCDSTTYQVSSVYDEGYTVGSWATTPNGTLGDTNTSRTTYSIVGDATLSLTSTTRKDTTLVPGRDLNRLMKTLAEGRSTSYSSASSKIKAIRMADSLPAGVTKYTVSTSGSEYPVYIFFDNTDNAGIIYFYTEANNIYMNSDSNSAFYNNKALSDIPALSSWNTSRVTLMYNMFRDTAITNIDALVNWDTGNVTNMSGMFSYATYLADINGARYWNTGNVANMSMFSYTAITNIDALSNWDTSNVTTMDSMFSGASSLTNIDGAINWDTSNVTTMDSMFSETSSLTNIDGATNWNTSKVKDMDFMFSHCAYDDDDYPGDTRFCTSSLVNIDGATNWDTGSVTTMKSMFKNATSLTNINGALNWNTSKVTNMFQMFQNAVSLTNIDGAINWDTGSVTSMKNMFAGYYRDSDDIRSSLANIDGARNWDTSNVVDMSYMFWSAVSLANVDGAANWNTSSVTTMEGLFRYAKIHNIDGVSGWNTSNVRDMSSTFWWAHVDNIDALASWDTSNVRNMTSMFLSAMITNLNGASNWNTSNVTNMTQMFMFAELTDIEGARNWDTSKVWDMHYMFYANNINDASPINDWDINSVQAKAGSSDIDNNKFFEMFGYTGYSHQPQDHPNFTRRAGTWNGSGTFIPYEEIASDQQSNGISSANASSLAIPRSSASTSQTMDIPNTDLADPSAPAYTQPYGSRQVEEQSDTSTDDGLTATLAIAATTAAASSIIFFVAARRKKDEDDEDTSFNR